MRRALFLVLLASCLGERVAPPPPPLEPPSLTLSHGLPIRLLATLRGEAPEAIAVELFVDFTCEGPLYRRLTPDELRDGVELALTLGDNVFSARSVGSLGQRSPCSSPVTAWRAVAVPPEPVEQLTATPGWVITGDSLTVRGRAPPDTQVRAHLNSCNEPPVSVGSAAEFADAGVTFHFVMDVTVSLAFDVINELGQTSTCTSRLAERDTTPPTTQIDWLSPMPSSERNAYVLVSGTDLQAWTAFQGPTCDAGVLASCAPGIFRGCSVELAADGGAVEPVWSVEAIDNAGNVACVVAPRFEYAPDASTAPEFTYVSFQPWLRMATGRDFLAFYETTDCTGPRLLVGNPSDAITRGLPFFDRSDGGALTARTSRLGVDDPCSAPWYQFNVGP